MVLVSQDGIQRPPFRFPKGRHTLQFLSCLENGLRPHGQLDPPLWSQRGKVSGHGALGRLGKSSLPVSPHVTSQTRACPAKTPQAVQGTGASLHYNMSFQGKVFPKLHKWSPQGSSKSTSSDKEDEEATDYMFWIIYPGKQSKFSKLPCPWAPGIHLPTEPENDRRCLEREDRRSGRGTWDLGSLSSPQIWEPITTLHLAHKDVRQDATWGSDKGVGFGIPAEPGQVTPPICLGFLICEAVMCAAPISQGC